MLRPTQEYSELIYGNVALRLMSDHWQLDVYLYYILSGRHLKYDVAGSELDTQFSCRFIAYIIDKKAHARERKTKEENCHSSP